MQSYEVLVKILNSVKVINYEYTHQTSSSEHSPFHLLDGNLGIPYELMESLYTYATSRPRDPTSTQIILLMNPENYTVWNHRRFTFSSYSTEHSLVHLVLKRHPKRAQAWAYLLWLWKQSVFNVDQELQACLDCASAYNQNYLAWNARRYLMTVFPDRLDKDWDIVGKWCSRNPSDMSGWTYRYWLGKKLFNNSLEWKQEQGDHVKQLIEIYSGHETLWVYVRLVGCDFTAFANEALCDDKNSTCAKKYLEWCHKFKS